MAPASADEPALAADIVALALQYGRYGYRRVTAMLHQTGWLVNHKRVYRLYREDGLSLRLKRQRRHVTAVSRERQLAASAPNELWSIDFVSDALCDSRRYGP